MLQPAVNLQQASLLSLHPSPPTRYKPEAAMLEKRRRTFHHGHRTIFFKTERATEPLCLSPVGPPVHRFVRDKKNKLLKITLDQMSTHNIGCNINVAKHNNPQKIQTNIIKNMKVPANLLYVNVRRGGPLNMCRCNRWCSFILIGPSSQPIHSQQQHHSLTLFLIIPFLYIPHIEERILLPLFPSLSFPLISFLLYSSSYNLFPFCLI